jgi:hypothetical protein
MALANFDGRSSYKLDIDNHYVTPFSSYPFYHDLITVFLLSCLFIRDFIVVGACEAGTYRCNRTFVMHYFVQNTIGLTIGIRKTGLNTGLFDVPIQHARIYTIWLRHDATHENDPERDGR